MVKLKFKKRNYFYYITFSKSIIFKKREIISIHIGQGGVQTGTAIWELFLLEHCIDPDGILPLRNSLDDLTFETFFHDVDNKRFVPRAIFVDSEPNVIDEVKCGIYGHLFHPDQLISGNSDGASNFARGYFTLKKQYIDIISDQIRKNVENCDRCQGYLLNHSLSGGTGSGLTGAVIRNLRMTFKKLPRIQFPIFPGPSLASSIVEPYNSSFHIHATISCSDMTTFFDNQALYDMCYKHLFMASPNFTNVNRITALIYSSITASLRFDGVLNSNLTDLLTNLIPYPRIHFPIVSHSPIMHKSRATHEVLTTNLMFKYLFSPDFQTMHCNLRRGFYLSIVLNGRGLIAPTELNESVVQLKSKYHIKFVDWSPRGFKLCLNNQIPTVVPESEIAFSEKVLTMISNSTSIKEYWSPLVQRFDMLFEKRAFMHWYINEGMEDTDFFETRNDIITLKSDYKEITKKIKIN